MNARKIILTTLSAALVAGAAIPAFAAPGDRGRHAGPRAAAMQDVMFVRLLKKADTNKDGKISMDELTSFQDQLFTAVDANKDGTLTRGEMLDYRQAKREEFRKNARTAASETQTEQAAPAKPGDEKAEALRDKRRDHHRRDREHAWRHGGDRGPHHVRWDRHGHRPMGAGMFRMIDEDRDGKITKAEASAATDKLFARMDTNKDNMITIDDLPDRPL